MARIVKIDYTLGLEDIPAKSVDWWVVLTVSMIDYVVQLEPRLFLKLFQDLYSIILFASCQDLIR